MAKRDGGEPPRIPRGLGQAGANYAQRNAQRPAVARRRLLFTIEFRRLQQHRFAAKSGSQPAPSARCT